ncbi:MAG: hypothetical protein J5887_01030 [Erysipelotrichaceae bacterium]|nr:hypothetical protein [Erysipelotrichaceae bacterium]
MKRVVLLLTVMALLIGSGGCSGVKGKTYDAGRFSFLVPEGWDYVEMAENFGGTTAVAVKGSAEDYTKVPQVSFLYSLPTENVMSSRDFFPDAEDLAAFDLGGYHWIPWRAVTEGLKFTCFESSGDFGYLTVYVMQAQPDNEDLSPSDPDVRAILASIKTQPEIQADWISIDANGVLTADLGRLEGYYWEDDGAMYTNTLEANSELSEGKFVIKPVSGDGVYSQSLILVSDDGRTYIGEAEVGAVFKNGKAVYVCEAEKKIYDEAISVNGDVDIDYEKISAEYLGTWKDEANKLTLYIQEFEGHPGILLAAVKASGKVWSMACYIEATEDLVYESISLNNGEAVDAIGWFSLQDGKVIWFYDENVDDFAQDTIFTKVD